MDARQAIHDIRVTVSGWLNMHHGGREASSCILLGLFVIEREMEDLRAKLEAERKREKREG